MRRAVAGRLSSKGWQVDVVRDAMQAHEAVRATLHVQETWIPKSTRAVRNDTHDLVGQEGMLSDAMERKQADAELQSHSQRQALLQAEKVAAMGGLLAGVAHELNNPLAVVLGQAELLEKALAGGPHAARARKIAEAAERCARIISNFLALARQQPPERRAVDLNAVVRAALELVAYPLRMDDVEVVLDLAPELPRLWADPHQLQRVVLNLVSNAHHAMRGASGPSMLILTTRAEPSAKRVSLDVADTGPGIPDDVKPRLFEPFFTTKPAGEGTGLGLPLCRGIVESHGGSIGLVSDAGGGACFRVELPVETPPLAAAPELEAENARPLEKCRILVVDDESAVAEMVAEMLSDQGHSADTAGTAAAALDALARGDYDLVLSDVKMPEMNGPTFFREATQRDARLARRFLFLTGDNLSPDVAKFLRESGLPSLSKPFREAELLAAVRSAVSGSPAELSR